jgi:hypothetical protein
MGFFLMKEPLSTVGHTLDLLNYLRNYLQNVVASTTIVEDKGIYLKLTSRKPKAFLKQKGLFLANKLLISAIWLALTCVSIFKPGLSSGRFQA